MKVSISISVLTCAFLSVALLGYTEPNSPSGEKSVPKLVTAAYNRIKSANSDADIDKLADLFSKDFKLFAINGRQNNGPTLWLEVRKMLIGLDRPGKHLMKVELLEEKGLIVTVRCTESIDWRPNPKKGFQTQRNYSVTTTDVWKIVNKGVKCISITEERLDGILPGGKRRHQERKK